MNRLLSVVGAHPTLVKMAPSSMNWKDSGIRHCLVSSKICRKGIRRNPAGSAGFWRLTACCVR